ncbi:MAG: PAS domain S-box protein [Candidatus Lernaella stagnicola]|nr:PAS domain S-box protein [Candidatus Lernaella stagnicola]
MSDARKLASFLQGFNFIDDAVLVSMDETGVVFCNEAAEGMLERKAADMIGLGMPEVVPLAGVDEWQKILRRVERTGKWTGEYYLPNGNGARIAVEWSVKRLSPVGFEGRGHIVIARDITTRKKIEQALRESESRCRLVADKVPDIIWQVDTDLNLTFCSPSARRMLGYTEAEIVAGGLGLFMSEEAIGEMRRHADAVIPGTGESRRRRKGWRAEVLHQCKDGRVIQVELTANPLFDNEGNVVGAVGITRDITDRKEKESELRASEERFRQVVESPVAGIAVLDDRGDLIYANGRMAEVLGYEVREMIGRHLTEFIAPAAREELLELFGLRHEGIDPTERHAADVLCRDGEIRTLEFSATEYSEAGGDPYTLVHTIDVTERRRAVSALRESESALRTLLNATHDIALLVDRGGAIEAVNRQFLQQQGGDANTYFGRNLFDLTPAPVVKSRRKHFAEVLETGRPVYYQDEVNGHFYSHSVYPVRDEKGGVVKVGVFSHDETERREAERAMALSERRFRSIAENAPVGIILVSNGEVVYTNREVQQISGRTHEELRGFGVLAAMVPEEHERLIQFVRQVREKGELPAQLLLWVERKDGEKRFVRCQFVSMADPPDLLNRLVVVTDLTDIHHARRALEESEERYRMLIEWSPEAIIVHRNGEFLFVNPAAAKLYGAEKPRDLLGHNVMDVVHPEDREIIAQRWSVIFNERRKVLPTETRGVRLDGSVIDVEAVVVPIDYEGEPAALALIRDISERKWAGNEIRRSQERLQAIFNNAATAICVIDHEQRFVQVNNKWLEVMQYSRDDVLRLLIEDVLPAEDRELGRERAQQLLDGVLADMRLELRFVRRDGCAIWADLSINTLRNERGEVEALIGVAVDITERKRAEQALQLSEERYRIISEMTSDYAYSLRISDDGEPVFEWVTEAFYRTTGYAPEDISFTASWQRIVHPDDAHLAVAHAERLMSGNADTTELRIKTKTGEVRWLRLTGRPIIEQKEGRAVRMYGAAEDITTRRRFEQALRDSEAEKALILSSVSEEIVHLDGDLRVVWANQAALDRNGMPADEMVGRQCSEIWLERRHVCDCCPTRLALSTGRPQRADVYSMGDSRVWRIESNPVLDETGAVVGVVEVGDEITQQHRAEEAARMHEQQMIQADKMITLGHLVSGVAHEINNPNQFIVANVGPLRTICHDVLPLLDRYCEEHGDFLLAGRNYSVRREQMAIMFVNIIEGSKRIKAIVDELRDYAGGRPSQVKQPVEVNEVVRSAIELLQNMIKNATHEFRVEYGDDLPSVQGSFQRLEQVVINLLQNACQAVADDETPIVLSTHENPKGDITIEVKDGGVGIAEEDLVHIIDPFFTTKRSAGGTGLGLSISAKIVADHNGRLEFESKPMRGTVATVTLPPMKPAHRKGEA